MIRLANLLYLDGRQLIIEEPDSVTVRYTDSMGSASFVYERTVASVKVMLPGFVVEQFTKNWNAYKEALEGAYRMVEDGTSRDKILTALDKFFEEVEGER